MKLRLLSALLLTLVLAACTMDVAPPQRAQPRHDYQIGQADGQRFIQGQLIVGYKEGVSADALAAKLGATVQNDWSQINAALLQLPRGQGVLKAQARAQGLKGLRYAEPNYVYEREKPVPGGAGAASLTPFQVSVSDPDFDKQWMHRQMNSLSAWNQGVTGEGVRIGIHDDFIDHRHPDLVGNMFYPGFDGFAAGEVDDIEDALITPTTPHDGIGFHGTSVAGTAAAVANDIGGLGTAFGASIVPLAINEPEGGGLVLSAIVNSAIFAVLGPDLSPGGDDRAPGTDPDTGPYVHIVNMSWGSIVYNQVVKDTMDLMLASGIVLVTSAGNTPTEGPAFPAWNPGLINVAATRATDERTGFSNRGLHLDVAAPGENVWTTATRGCIYATPDGSSCSDDDPEVAYNYIGGTSFSSPAAAGTAALILEASAERDADGNITGLLSAAQVRKILTDTAFQPAGYERSALGAGIVDSGAAVARALEHADNPVPDGGTLAVQVVLEDDPEMPLPLVGLTLIPQDGDAAVKYTQTSDGSLFFPTGVGLFQQMDAGTYTLQASGLYSSATGLPASTAEMTVELTPGDVTPVQIVLDVELFEDPFEPNNTLETAADLGETGITVRASLYDASADSDTDFYSIPVSAGESYRVGVVSVSGNFDAVLSVYDESGALIAENDDGRGFSRDPLVQFEAPEDGLVYLEVTEFGAADGFAVNSPFSLYDLDVAPYIGEEEEPNGSATVIGSTIQNVDFTDAQEIPLGSALDAALTDGDADIFMMEVPAGETIVAGTQIPLDSDLDTILGIYNEAGEQVAFNDTYLATRAFYTTQEGGVYYVVVALFDGVAGTAEGDYGLMVTRHLNLPTE